MRRIVPLRQDTDAVFHLRCSGKCPVLLYFIKRLEAFGLGVKEKNKSYQTMERDTVVLIVTCDRLRLNELADEFGMLKETRLGLLSPFRLANAAEFKRFNQDNFFLPCEELLLLSQILDQIGTDTFVQSQEPQHSNRRRMLEPHRIRSYYGDDTGFYISLIQHTITWLLLPLAALGCLVEPNIVTILWAALVVQFWKRKYARLCCDWASTEPRATRMEFDPSRSPYFTCVKALLGCFITGAMLWVSLLWSLMTLDLQGFVTTESLRFGVVFKNGLLSYVPFALQYTGIFLINRAYRLVARQITNAEPQGRYKSLVFKCFCFESVSWYFAAFYLALVEDNFDWLKIQLTQLCIFDSIRRILGYLINHNPRFNTFDGYMDLVLQFGLVILFASVFPLASALFLLTSCFQLYFEIQRLTFRCQRPSVQRAEDIDVWISLLTTLVWLSTFTNTFLTSQAQDLAARVVTEHFLLLSVKCIFSVIATTPKAVARELHRRNNKAGFII